LLLADFGNAVELDPGARTRDQAQLFSAVYNIVTAEHRELHPTAGDRNVLGNEVDDFFQLRDPDVGLTPAALRKELRRQLRAQAPSAPQLRLNVEPAGLVSHGFVLEDLLHLSEHEAAAPLLATLATGDTAGQLPRDEAARLGEDLAHRIREQLGDPGTPSGPTEIVLNLDTTASAVVGAQLAQAVSNSLRHRIQLVMVPGAAPVGICPTLATTEA
jgi:hypothetical protein